MENGLKHNTGTAPPRLSPGKAFLRLVRLPNLLMVALTQYLLYYLVLRPAFLRFQIETVLDDLQFTLLVIVTLLISAGGYIINDIIDLPTDLVNRPSRVIVGRSLPLQTAYWLYFLVNLTGYCLSIYLAFIAGNLKLLWLFILAVTGLYFYSKVFKRRLLSGNVLIAAYCAGVAGIVWFAERQGMAIMAVEAPETAGRINRLFSWYLLFAFLSTMLREIIKDIEDMRGDVHLHCRTLPIVWGEKAAKGVAALFGVAMLAALGVLVGQYTPDVSYLILGILILGIGGPVLLALFWLVRARSRSDYHRLSQLAKLIMLSGILLLLLISNP